MSRSDERMLKWQIVYFPVMIAWEVRIVSPISSVGQMLLDK